MWVRAKSGASLRSGVGTFEVSCFDCKKKKACRELGGVKKNNGDCTGEWNLPLIQQKKGTRLSCDIGETLGTSPRGRGDDDGQRMMRTWEGTLKLSKEA